MKLQCVILSSTFVLTAQLHAEQVNLKDQIGMCLTYDFRLEISLDKVEEWAESVESLNANYVLGSVAYYGLKVSFYAERGGKVVIFYPREFSPALIFYRFSGNGGYPDKNNLYEVLLQLAKAVEIGLTGKPGYCYVPLQDCRNMFIRSDHIILRALGDIKIRQVFVSHSSRDISFNGNEIELERFSGRRYRLYHRDITNYFLQSIEARRDIEISGGKFQIMIFYQEGTKP